MFWQKTLGIAWDAGVPVGIREALLRNIEALHPTCIEFAVQAIHMMKEAQARAAQEELWQKKNSAKAKRTDVVAAGREAQEAAEAAASWCFQALLLSSPPPLGRDSLPVAAC